MLTLCTPEYAPMHILVLQNAFVSLLPCMQSLLPINVPKQEHYYAMQFWLCCYEFLKVYMTAFMLKRLQKAHLVSPMQCFSDDQRNIANLAQNGCVFESAHSYGLAAALYEP